MFRREKFCCFIGKLNCFQDYFRRFVIICLTGRFCNCSQTNREKVLLGLAIGVAGQIMTKPCPEHAIYIDNYLEVVSNYSNFVFKTHFRMSKTAFEEFCQLVGNTIKRKPNRTCFNSIEKSCLIFIWTVANQEPFRSIGDRFGMSRGNAHYLFTKMVETVVQLAPSLIQFPNFSEQHQIAKRFKTRCGIPGIIGAVDGSYVSIKEPKENKDRFYNRKGVPSLILQGTCDHKKRFIDVAGGFPGSMHDARVFQCSPLGKSCETGVWNQKFHLIGDSAYALTLYMLPPYRDNGHLNEKQRNFNRRQSSARSVIERAFCLLKGKFRRIKGMMDIEKLDLASNIILAVCCVHNFLIGRDDYDEDECDGCSCCSQAIVSLDGTYANETLDFTESRSSVEQGVNKRDLISERLKILRQ